MLDEVISAAEADNRDLRIAIAKIAEARARVGIAEAARSPQLSLGPSLRWTIFDGGRVRSQINVEDAILEQTVLLYEQAVLRALGEVETAMTAFIEQRIRLDAVTRAADSAREAFGLAKGLFRDGLIDFQDVLTIQQDLITAEGNVAEARGLAGQNLVSLYKALGGGWDPSEGETSN